MVSTIVDSRLGQFLNDIKEDFHHQLGMPSEDFQHKFDLVVEGQQVLAEKVERVEENLKREIHKVDHHVTAVSADLVEHRRDTEAHRKGWRVGEE